MIRHVHHHGGPAAELVSSTNPESPGAIVVSRTCWNEAELWTRQRGRPLDSGDVANLAVALGVLHTIPWDDAPGTSVPWMRDRHEIEAALAELGRRMQACRPADGYMLDPLWSLVLAWLHANIPLRTTLPALLIGGPNAQWLLSRADSLPLVLDWRRSRLGEGAQDLAALRPVIPAVMWEEFLARYIAVGGALPSEEVLRFYEVWHAACRYVEACRGTARLRTRQGDLYDAAQALLEAPAHLSECLSLAFGR